MTYAPGSILSVDIVYEPSILLKVLALGWVNAVSTTSYRFNFTQGTGVPEPCRVTFPVNNESFSNFASSKYIFPVLVLLLIRLMPTENVFTGACAVMVTSFHLSGPPAAARLLYPTVLPDLS
ncbi:hypothetical protein D3C73_1055780 [compost metagenome]